MHTLLFRRLAFVSIVASLLAIAATALALDPNKDGWYHTGDGSGPRASPSST